MVQDEGQPGKQRALQGSVEGRQRAALQAVCFRARGMHCLEGRCGKIYGGAKIMVVHLSNLLNPLTARIVTCSQSLAGVVWAS